ncbi:MDR family MFS transporter [Bacillus subtilis]|uniref:MDR family MFS transporter n=1 Tax=Bacillus subtilis TaxID=1423 RepID=UPI001362A940|nr:MFS transporter [Bacillus subtilis]MBO3634917.1 MFS transporter [Bacillus subtilis]QHJ97491.1 Multidrug resistance protein MdtH [Bacillus subtilis]WIY67463.1 MFS transporter [Bacillus subtilis]
MKKWKDIHPISWTIIIGTIFGRMATSMSIPFLAIYLTAVQGASASYAGLVIAASSSVGILASFYGGYISDKFGRKNMMLVSIFGWMLVFAGFAAASHLWVFFVVNALNGLCKSLFEPASKALLSDMTEEKTRLLVFNLRYAAINIGVVFGPVLGLYFGSSQSTTPFLVPAVIYGLYGIVLALQFKKHPSLSAPAQSRNMSVREAFMVTQKDYLFTIALVGITLCTFGYSQFSSTFPQYMAQNPLIGNGTKLYGLMLTLNAIVVLATQFPIVHFAKRFSPLCSLMLGNVMVSISMAIFTVSHGVPSIVMIVITFTIGEVLLFSMMDLYVDQFAKTGLKGTYFGAIGFSQLGNVIGPWVGGICIDLFGAGRPIYIFSVLSGITLLGLPFLAFAYRQMKTETTKHRSRLEKPL